MPKWAQFNVTVVAKDINSLIEQYSHCICGQCFYFFLINQVLYQELSESTELNRTEILFQRIVFKMNTYKMCSTCLVNTESPLYLP